MSLLDPHDRAIDRRRVSRRLGVVSLLSLWLAALTAALSPVTGSAQASATRDVAPTAAVTGVTKTVVATRTHLVNGADVLVDTRTIRMHVDVTTNLRDRQPINVSWTGAHPTGGVASDPNSGQAASLEYPMVLMECRGIDSSSVAPAKRLTPETCWTQTPRERVQSTGETFPPYRVDRYASPADRQRSVGLPNALPPKCNIGPVNRWMPFVAVDGHVYYGGPDGCAQLPPEASAEDQRTPPNTTYAHTDLAGAGAAKFVVNTVDTNASMGCSSTVPCALVAIPVMGISCDAAAAGLPPADRPSVISQPSVQAECGGTGNYDPAAPRAIVSDSEDPTVSGRLWWSASNWRNRIVLPLSFVPEASTCDLANTAKPILIYGSQAMRQATLQWAPAFCTNPKLFKFQHVQTSEPQAKNLVDTGNVEAALAGAPPSTPFTKPIVQAPVAVSGFAIAYVIDDAHGDPVSTLRLSPRLLAKLMTQSYSSSPTVASDYDALKTNPLDLGQDPEYRALNPGAFNLARTTDAAAVLFSVSSDSDVIRALTGYINADPEARAWLDGQADPWGMKVNPSYKGIALPVDGWPLLDTHISAGAASQNQCVADNPAPWLNLVAAPVADPSIVTLNMQFGIANSQILCQSAGNPNQKLVALGRETPGQRFVVGLVSLADADRYQLNVAQLQTHVDSVPTAPFTDATGRTFVAPTTASLKATVALLKPVKALGTFPIPYEALRGTAGKGAYPGTMLMTLDAPTSGLKADDARKLATFVRWATSTGQTPGGGNGQLPGGYLPLTSANGAAPLVAYAGTAATALAAQQGYVPAVDGSSTPPPAASPTPSPSDVPSTGQPASGPSPQPDSSGGGAGSPAPSASQSASASASTVLIAAAGSTSPIVVGPLGASIPALLGIALLTGVGALVLGLWGRT